MMKKLTQLRYFSLILKPVIYKLFIKFLHHLKPINELSLNLSPCAKTAELEEMGIILGEKPSLYKLYLDVNHPMSFDDSVNMMLKSIKRNRTLEWLRHRKHYKNPII